MSNNNQSNKSKIFTGVDNTSAPKPATPVTSTGTRKTSHEHNTVKQDFLFDKKNYQLMIAGMVLIILGFVLMSGGKSEDPHVFNYDEVYSFRRITLAPLLVLLGFAVEIYATLRKQQN